MKRSADVTGFTFIVEAIGDRNRVWIGLNHRVQCRIELLNTIQITSHQIVRRELAVRHRGLQLRNCRFDKRETASTKRGAFEERVKAAGQKCGTAGCGRAEETSSADMMIVDLGRFMRLL